ncbi:MAG: histidine kinase [Paraglaciecola sp.]|nr:histidine kinase [Paraglaciecola sp.]
MLKHWATGLKQHFSAFAENQLAMMAAILLESSIRQFSFQSANAFTFLSIWAQLILESLPLLVAHYMVFKAQGWRALLIWTVGFLLYPMLCFSMADFDSGYADWSLFSVQGWLLLLGASLGFGLSRLVAKGDHSRYSQFVTRLFSLNSVLLLLMICWAVLWSAMFASTDDPVRNQPIKTVINSDTLIVNFYYFLDYLWQFLVMGILVLWVYWCNRYLLIRRVLARSGVFAYMTACLIFIIVGTPMLATVVLWLPMNIADWTFLPSEDYNIFAPINFRFIGLLLAVSTPIILAFERQQQGKAMAEIAQRQSQTELQLLQQQVNPHFLFNTLNNLYALTLTGAKEAPAVIMQLANLLRYTVYEGQNQRVSLAQEIQYIQDFLALQGIRSANKCQLKVHFPEQTQHWQLAPLLLIILVENAFKHGVEPSQELCFVTINIDIEGATLIMQCNNTLPKRATFGETGIGLDNLKRRLTLLYPGKHHLRVQKQNAEWQTELRLELEPCTAP